MGGPRIALVGFTILAIAAGPAYGQAMYSYVDAQGIRHLTNIPPTGTVRELSVSGADSGWVKAENPGKGSAKPSLDSLIEKYAREYRLDPELLRSMIKTESDFNPRAVSPKGAQGLMQLMPATAARLGVKDPFDPEDNIRGGAQHVRTLLDTFNNDLTLSLAAYNAGENLVQRMGRIPNYRETHQYVRNITQLYGKNRMSLPNEAASQPSPMMFRFIDKDGVLNLTNIPPVEPSGVRDGDSGQQLGVPR